MLAGERSRRGCGLTKKQVKVCISLSGLCQIEVARLLVWLCRAVARAVATGWCGCEVALTWIFFFFYIVDTHIEVRRPPES